MELFGIFFTQGNALRRYEGSLFYNSTGPYSFLLFVLRSLGISCIIWWKEGLFTNKIGHLAGKCNALLDTLASYIPQR